MKLCGNCGSEINETAKFCPRCGTPAAANETAGAAQPVENTMQPDASAPQPGSSAPQPGVSAPQPAFSAPRPSSVGVQTKPAEPTNSPAGGVKKRVPRMALIIAAIVVVLAVGLLIGVGAVQNSPKALIGTSISNTLKSLQSPDEGALAVVTNVLNGGSIEVSADLSEWDILYGSMPFSGRMKLYSDISERKFAAEASLSYDGESPVDMKLYASQDAIVLGSDALLKEKYGINLKKAAANLDNSILAPDSGTDFALDEYMFELLRNLFSTIGESNKELEKDISSLSGKYLELLIDAACQAGEAEKESATLNIGSENVKTTAITLTLDNEAMAEIIKTLAKEAAKDAKLRETVKKLSRFDYEILFGFYDYRSNYVVPDEDEVNERIDEFFDSLVENAEELAEQLEEETDIKLILEFHVAKDGKTLAAFSMKAKEGGEMAYSLSLTLGKRLGSSEEISLKINDGWSDTVLRYVVSENTKTDYSAKLTLQDGYSSQSVKIAWNKSDGSYRISSEEVELRGTLKQSGKKTTVTVEEVSSYGTSMEIGLTVVLNESEATPSAGSFTEVLTISESKIEDLAEDVVERFMESSLYSLLRYF